MKTAAKVTIVALLIAVGLMAVYIASAPYPQPPMPTNLIGLISVISAVAIVFGFDWYRRSHGSRPPPQRRKSAPK
jgi:hypothetical protein